MKLNGRLQFARPGGALAAALLLLAGCDFGIETVNIDRTQLTSVEPEFQLNSVIVNSAPTIDMMRCEATIVQQHLRVFTGVGACANFNLDARQNTAGNWTNGYQTRARALVDILDQTRDDAARSNLYNMARIMRAYTFMRITDTYGDVPYREAALGFKAGNVFPTYDKQEFIYTSPEGILEELAKASAALDPAKAAPRDALYNGDVARWKRFGNSLLLRAAMRLSKVKPDLAQQYVARAVAGGLLQSNADNATVRHTNEYRNGPGATLNANEGFNEYLPAPFVDYLKGRNDPRLAAIAVRYPTAVSSAGQTAANANRTPAAQIGIPMGYDNNTIGTVVKQLGLPSVYAFTQTDRLRMLDVLAPSFLVTYPQTQLLLAEAAFRRWAPGDPATLYANGIRAHMQKISTSYQNTAIPQAAIDAFVAANPLQAGKELEQINTEYWVASFLITDEAWANFRRSCYPALPPNPLQGDLGPNERFIRRLGYPDGERTLNPNMKDGTSPDRIDTRMWWDVKVSATC